jgi:hypothetical protein
VLAGFGPLFDRSDDLRAEQPLSDLDRYKFQMPAIQIVVGGL